MGNHADGHESQWKLGLGLWVLEVTVQPGLTGLLLLSNMAVKPDVM